MGVIKRGLLGGFSGRVANIVGSSWKGIAYMRALPLSVANPNTAAQQVVRQGFKTAVQCGRQLVSTLFPNFINPFVERMSGFNAFVGENSVNMTTWLLTDWSSIVMSTGTIPAVTIDSVGYDAGTGDCEVNWTMAAGYIPPMSPPKAFAINVKKKLKSAGCQDTLATIDDEFAAFDIGVGLEIGDMLEIWMSFVSDDGKSVSNSTHFQYEVA